MNLYGKTHLGGILNLATFDINTTTLFGIVTSVYRRVKTSFLSVNLNYAEQVSNQKWQQR
jgi:hypothetical protein